VAEMFKENQKVIFTGNGYSAEWPVEAAKRGLSNLRNTPAAVATFNSAANKELFKKMQVCGEDEVDARAEVMLESYITTLSIEASTLIRMVDTGIVPACAKDLATYAGAPELAGDRKEVYSNIVKETNALKALLAKEEEELLAQAKHMCDVVKPKMAVVRSFVDKAEELLQAGLYPYPSYEALLYSHHH